MWRSELEGQNGNQGRKKGKGKKRKGEKKNEEGKKKSHSGIRTCDLPLHRHSLSPKNRMYHISIADFHFDDLIVAAVAPPIIEKKLLTFTI